MFTGIVEEVGRVTRLERQASRARLGVACARVRVDAELGASIAVDGCCVTISGLTTAGFEADLMLDTLAATMLGDLASDDPVNLERPLATDGRFGGHLVQGHVDGVGTIVGREDRVGCVLLTVAAPPTVAPYLVRKGSIAVQGVSLTVADTDPGEQTFRVGLVPHTCQVTTLGGLAVGDRVNLEADIIAKYLEQLLRGGVAPAPGAVTRGGGDEPDG
ncbi:MAG: riboflavin synthase [Actinomycetota bacterium]|nr:riboflavin synthase [Actinomycetota bacterium]